MTVCEMLGLLIPTRLLPHGLLSPMYVKLNPRSALVCALGIFNTVSTTGSVSGLPVLNDPINTPSQTTGMKSRVGDFMHPGLWHTHNNLETIMIGVKDGHEPWKSAYANFSQGFYSQSNVSSLRNPHKTIRTL